MFWDKPEENHIKKMFKTRVRERAVQGDSKNVCE